ncbi:hypothetical protein TWF225_001927 [Orbilia oligospora]|uniref:Uncharacterized protein n=1 Tax=Orbilia oligospora TaxID=2813651 RepID=A0A7C8PUE1_ORBOL|nr:hypothetical protein TWF751_011591 [Orbilia oligospora]KAF3190965.1 hypothetical protein TWF225_001927 [Orbilia oligospora]KAF3262191.1 hypothetical protein TWF217_004261 [Orbilia oligospora]KAF3265322.1 hypothetical protein TWF128_000594 [Orbilia oligospora]KAF3293867.1 hypothetical protein TWF132_004449 [Orbilia oligospora]
MEVAAPSFSSLGFETLTPLLYYSSGESKNSTGSSAAAGVNTPQIPPDSARYDLVMIWGWMNAAPRHLVKFVQLHRSLQPGVPIVFVGSTTASWFGYTNALRISHPLIFDLVKALPESPKIFAHTFSNGGTSGFSDFLAHYRYEVGSAMPLSAMIIDSAPGGIKFPSALTRGVNAFLEIIRNQVVKTILYPIVYLLVTIVYVPPKIIGMEDPISRMRRTLNDETLVSEGGIRGYTYCKGDVMVGWEDILEHANEAEERGWKVSRLGFEGGTHVGCYRHHPREYEEFVRQIRTSSARNT